jgi:diadenosine tetraphosphate (Ap4A) HIT family hydrolase
MIFEQEISLYNVIMKIKTKEKFSTPLEGSVFYEDEEIYACLANYPIAPGHCIVVWKKNVPDLHLLNGVDYKKLMKIVDIVRNALLNVMNTDKVYLLYMDEICHVHWHLIPRTSNEQGCTLLEHQPKALIDISLADQIKKAL